ncbi:MAG: NAD(+) synthase [Bacteroidales bacterium]|nr:NAD(+) synthase [Bacteroidales bacterium]
MKIQINQLNPKTLGFNFNKKIITDSLKEVNSDVLSVFPELSVSGGPLYNSTSYSDIFLSSSKVCESLLLEKRDLVFGSPIEIEGKKFNSMIMVEGGELLAISTKRNLNQFDIGFEQGTGIEVIKYKNQSIGFGFLEDIKDFEEKKTKVDLLIISSNTIFHHEGHKELLNELIVLVRKLKTTLVFSNRAGAEGGYIFSGGSFILNQKGELCGSLPNFKYHSQSFNTETLKPIAQNSPSRLKNLYEALILAIRDYYHKNNIEKATLGLSGGIDSALVLALAVNALGKENVVGILMPSEFSSDHSVKDALDSAKNSGVEHHIIPIKDCFDQCSNTFDRVFPNQTFSIAEENIQSRLRCLTLMWYSNKFGGALLNTTNKSEASVGYGTLYGDTSGALSIIADMYKTEVWELSQYINEEWLKSNPDSDSVPIPWNSITKAPSAELRFEQKDTDSLPDYDILDKILIKHIDHKKSLEEIVEEFESQSLEVDKSVIERIIKLVKINEWKRRQCPTAVKLTENCFGIDRRVPIS